MYELLFKYTRSSGSYTIVRLFWVGDDAYFKVHESVNRIPKVNDRFTPNADEAIAAISKRLAPQYEYLGKVMNDI